MSGLIFHRDGWMREGECEGFSSEGRGMILDSLDGEYED